MISQCLASKLHGFFTLFKWIFNGFDLVCLLDVWKWIWNINLSYISLIIELLCSLYQRILAVLNGNLTWDGLLQWKSRCLRDQFSWTHFILAQIMLLEEESNTKSLYQYMKYIINPFLMKFCFIECFFLTKRSYHPFTSVWVCFTITNVIEKKLRYYKNDNTIWNIIVTTLK